MPKLSDFAKAIDEMKATMTECLEANNTLVEKLSEIDENIWDLSRWELATIENIREILEELASATAIEDDEDKLALLDSLAGRARRALGMPPDA